LRTEIEKKEKVKKKQNLDSLIFVGVKRERHHDASNNHSKSMLSYTILFYFFGLFEKNKRKRRW